MRTSDFDFGLPPERIALRPAVPRESAKLLLVRDGLTDLHVADLPRLLRAGDVLVFNNTKVIPAALTGQRVGRGVASPRIEALLHLRLSASTWRAFAKPGKKLQAGDNLQFGSLNAKLLEKGEAGEITLEFDCAGPDLDEALAREGRMPLPPYIEGKRATDAQDAQDYQTIFAEKSGAVAAPTAGLHFTPKLVQQCQAAGITTEFVTLHVGAGTFLPVKAEDTKDHKMHSEWGELTPDVARRLQQARQKGGRIVAVGTTSLRILEAAALEPFAGTTNIFITPGYQFKAVDVLLTNFHLPRSTLFMLVSAFAGLPRMRHAYAHAIEQHYRFYSYGDCCLLYPDSP